MRIALHQIQDALAEDNLDGWLLYDFHGSNSIACALADIHGLVTRRWFCWLPRYGESVIIRHTMEGEPFKHLNAVTRTYLSWRQMDDALRETLKGARRIAMEYSPDNAIPYVARVDAGTIDKIRHWGIEVTSSADLVARFLARWSPAQIASHRRAAAALIRIQDQAFGFIAEVIRAGKIINEYQVVQFIRDRFKQEGLIADDGPICAVDANSGSPHYEPTREHAATIGPNQLVLIDLWAKEQAARAVYADITWTAYTGAAAPVRVADVFQVVAAARDRAVAFVNERLSAGQPVAGFEVDDAVRAVIAEAGYGESFIHRTGHSIGTEVHGVGPNIDNLETQDRRRLSEAMCFSVEPGIYLPDFGIRSEIDVLIENGRAVVTTLPLQTELRSLLP